MRKPLVVVLGASGYLGTAIAAAFADQPMRLRLVARRPAAVPRQAVDAEVRTADLTDVGQLAEAVRGADTVVHLVAKIGGATSWRGAEADPAVARVNVGVVRDLVDVVRAEGRNPAVLFAGTVASVGVPNRIRIDGSEPDAPVSAYPRQKLEAERILAAATEEGVLRAVTLRLPTIFGPGTGARGIVPGMIGRALAGEALTLWDREVRRDLVHIDDVARAFVAAHHHADALAGRHWLVGTGMSEPLGVIFSMIATAVSVRTGLPPVPVNQVAPPPEAEATDLHGVEVDASAFRLVTGWSPRVGRLAALGELVDELARGDVRAAG
ncbi:NAD-dependent epimerase/dehydratase family protein [Lentzea albidocapillata]|uniref:NAD-dependent epimerase/dehydratase family protein n=1 Tax=Lentzea albidocapillata TaxID=40571 RepID=UPI001C40BA4D|nr:NAD-dependent epimerase/dehydratase family protein [Lentzea albidocapillata]